MTDYSDHNDAPSLDDVVLHISHAMEVLDRLIASHESRTAADQRILRQMVRRLCRPSRLPLRKRAREIAGLMRRFTLLCRLDEHRNKLQSLRDDFTLLAEGQQVPSSDIPYWRSEFYANLTAVLVLDRDIFTEISPENSKNDVFG